MNLEVIKFYLDEILKAGTLEIEIVKTIKISRKYGIIKPIISALIYNQFFMSFL